MTDAKEKAWEEHHKNIATPKDVAWANKVDFDAGWNAAMKYVMREVAILRYAAFEKQVPFDEYIDLLFQGEDE